MTILILALPAVWCGYQWYQHFIRARVARHFVEAVQKLDGPRICDLSTPSNRTELNLRPDRAVAIIKAVFDVESTKVTDLEYQPPSARDAEVVWCWWARWHSNDGSDIPPGGWSPHSTLSSAVNVRPTDEGYKVDFACFLNGSFVYKWGLEKGQVRFAELRRELGLYAGTPPKNPRSWGPGIAAYEGLPPPVLNKTAIERRKQRQGR